MLKLAKGLVLLVGLIHLGIAVLEIFFWKEPWVHRQFAGLKFTDAEAVRVAPVVANAGLYNSFLGVGLIWSAISGVGGLSVRVFFLSCVVLAGVFGAVTLKQPSILILQSFPGVLGLVCLWLTRGSR